MSNTDIAGRLFISTRTVETHVISMLQKTSSVSRDCPQTPTSASTDRPLTDCGDG